jgi:hypothetical protein
LPKFDRDQVANLPVTGDGSDSDELERSCPSDADWDVFLADDDERDPLPERGDFWDDGLFDE